MSEFTLTDNIKTYETMRETLECDHFGQWVVLHSKEVAGFYPDFEEAAAQAIEQFGRGPYLIRQIGVLPPPLPASVLYQPLQ